MNNLELMQARLKNRGGQLQQDRMIADKVRTLQKAIKYSYQGAQVSLLDLDDTGNLKTITPFPALINPNRVVADYDEKIISAEYKYGLTAGSIIKWIRNTEDLNNKETYWLVYLQDLTELAYFKADIRKCSYQIKYKNKKTNQNEIIYAAIKGPSEKKISSIQKSQYNLDIPNYTITLLIQKNKKTLEYFQRYTRFYLNNLTFDDDTPTCWRVEAVDSISSPGILEIHAKEYYINDDKDIIIDDNGNIDYVVNGNVQELEDKSIGNIVGDTVIKPGFSYTYTCKKIDGAVWEYDTKLPITAKIQDNTIEIVWTALYSGSFSLCYANSKKEIIVESLF